MTIQSFARVLGKREDDPSFLAFLDANYGDISPSVDRYDQAAYFGFKEVGLCFVFEEEQFLMRNPDAGTPGVFRLDTVHFIHSGREPEYSGYAGILLPGVAFGDRRESVHSLLGEPTYGQQSTLPAVQGKERSVILDRYDYGDYNISFEYDADADCLNLVCLSLSPDKKIEAD